MELQINLHRFRSKAHQIDRSSLTRVLHMINVPKGTRIIWNGLDSHHLHSITINQITNTSIAQLIKNSFRSHQWSFSFGTMPASRASLFAVAELMCPHGPRPIIIFWYQKRTVRSHTSSSRRRHADDHQFHSNLIIYNQNRSRSRSILIKSYRQTIQLTHT